MPDQTPVTDDDRRNARKWAEDSRGYGDPGSYLDCAARVILATVPAPPAPLADEIRGIRDSPFTKDMHKLSELADRVEAVEKESERVETLKKQWSEVVSDLADQTKLTSQYVTERDDARAEVERLTVSLNRQCTTVTPSVHNTDAVSASSDTLPDRAEVERLTSIIKNHPDSEYVFAPGGVIGKQAKVNLDRMNLPDPADVPTGEPWLVEYKGVRRIALRSDPDDGKAWYLPSRELNREGATWVRDSELALVARLVPERPARTIDRPEDLDKLPVGSVVVDGIGRAASRFLPDGSFHRSDGLVLTASQCFGHGPVTVIHEPEVTA